MFKGNNIVKDFETYLIESGIWKSWNRREREWPSVLGDLMDKTASRSSEENKKLQEKDMLWWINLVKLQNVYGDDFDIFGEYIEATGQTSFVNGQFLTPACVCEMLARLHPDEDKEVYPVEITDCASGSGRMMIAHSKMMKEERPDYWPMDYIYLNKDLDYKMFIFTTLNASLRNLQSVNVWGDSLAGTTMKIFITLPTRFGRAIWYDKSTKDKKSENKEIRSANKAG